MIKTLTIKGITSHSVARILKKIMSSLEKVRHLGNMVNHEKISQELEKEAKFRIKLKTHLLATLVLLGNTEFPKLKLWRQFIYGSYC